MVYSYYEDRISELEKIRSDIKYLEPEQVNLDRIRGFLGYVQADLELLASLRRPNVYTLKRLEDGSTEITIQLVTDNDYAEELVGQLWLGLEPPVSDVQTAAAPTPAEPAVTPQSPPE